MKKFKLNKLEKREMSNIYAGGIKGGFAVGGYHSGGGGSSSCSCACAYADSGGSSTSDNRSANNADGLHSVT